MVSKEEYLDYLSKNVTDEDKKKIKKVNRVYNILNPITIVVEIILIALSIILFVNNWGIYSLILLVLAMIINFLFPYVSDKQKNKLISELLKYKNGIISYLLQDYKYFYEEDGKVDRKLFYESFLDVDYDKLNSEDKFGIVICDDNSNKKITTFVVCDVNTTYSYNGREYESFSGVFAYVRFDKEFNYQLIINRPDYINRKKLENVELESIEFDKNFLVKTTNQVEARRILNTDFMQSLMQLNIKLKDFGLVIDRKNMCLSLKNRNLFDFDEIKLGDNLEKMFEGCYNDACFIKILIEYVIKKNILLN